MLRRADPRRLMRRVAPARLTRMAAADSRRLARRIDTDAERLTRRIGTVFTSRLHDERVAAWLGLCLGVSFTVAFVTGLVSHFMQHPPSWMVWPSRPVGLYRFTQGAHVICGLATVPLLLAKLWTVYPKLWQWPPIRSVAHAARRGVVFLLVGGSLFQLVTGLFNVDYWYPFPFFFTVAHYWTAYVVFGAVLIHAADEWAKVKGLRRHPPPYGPSRRGFLATVAGACGLVAVTTVGETFTPLGDLAVLAPGAPAPVRSACPSTRPRSRRRHPEHRLAARGHRCRTAGALARPGRPARDAPARRTTADRLCRGVERRGHLGRSTAEGRPARGRRRGRRACTRRVAAEGGLYRASQVDPPHWHDPLTLLALEVNGEPLSLDHGYPCRLIAPDRPGVMQTKWVAKLEVS